MKKFLFYLFPLLTLIACSKDFEEAGPDQSSVTNFDPTVSFLKLQDNSTPIAGAVDIEASGDVTIQWDVLPECNLDTTVSLQKLSAGKYRLPIKWLKKSDEGTYGPALSTFCAWAKIVDNHRIKNVPLIWADEVDSVEIMKQIERHSLLTRSADGESRDASSVTILADQPFLLDETTCGQIPFTFVGNMCAVDITQLTEDNNNLGYHLDLSGIQSLYMSGSTVNTIDLAWDTQGPPTDDFIGYVSLTPIGGVRKNVYVQWVAPVSATLDYDSSNLPAGNIPSGGGTYIFYFAGSYTGNVQLRAMAGTTVIATGAAVINKEPAITIPANSSSSELNITFQYKRDDDPSWIEVGTATNKTQDARSTSSGVIPGILIPNGDIADEGGTVYCYFTGASTSSLIFRAITGTTELARTTGNVPSLLSLAIPGITGSSDRIITFQYSTDGGSNWELVESKTQVAEFLSVDAIEPSYDIPSAGGVYTCKIGGTYSKRINVHAVANNVVIASGATTVPGTVQLTIPSFTGAANRLITFEYSKSDGPWVLIEVKRQRGY